MMNVDVGDITRYCLWKTLGSDQIGVWSSDINDGTGSSGTDLPQWKNDANDQQSSYTGQLSA